jgi:hypothetical protein
MLNSKNYLIHKRAQVGETVSWVIATVVIIAILIFFIYVSILISKTKAIGLSNLQSDISGKPASLMQKTSFGYQLSENKNKELIDSILDKENK